MAKGKSIYFSKKELENLNEFINHWDDKLSAEDEDFYKFWLEKVGSAFGKIVEVCKTESKMTLADEIKILDQEFDSLPDEEKIRFSEETESRQTER